MPRPMESPIAPCLTAVSLAARSRLFADALPLAILLCHRVEIAVLLQAIEDAGIDIILDLAAAAGKLRQDIFRALARRLDIGRRLLLEVVVADVDDLGVGDAELLGQHLLGALLVA